MAKIMVTGANGYIGKNLLQQLRTGTDEIIPVYNSDPNNFRSEPDEVDITDDMFVSETMRYYNPDVIIHLAAVSRVKGDTEFPTRISMVNVVGTHNLLEYAPEGCRFVFASSAAVYGTRSCMCDNLTPCNPESVYAATKAAGEHLVSAYTSLGRVKGVSLRLVAQVGPHSTHGLFHDIIRKLRSDSEYLELIGDCPGSCKPFMHVLDTVRYLRAFAIENKFTSHWNISPNDALTVEDFAKICMQGLGIQKPIKWLGWEANWPGDSPNLLVDGYYARLNSGLMPKYKTSADAVKQAVIDVLGKESV